MIQDVLLLAGVLLAIVAVGVFLFALRHAPEGTEDETGFHYRKSGTPASRPPFPDTSTRIRAKKKESPAGLHIPAA